MAILADCHSAQTYILALSAEVLCFLFSFGFVYLQEFFFWKSDTWEWVVLADFAFCLLLGRWSLIAAKMPGRTDNDIKNHWNTRLKKKLCDMGIDPVTHKPIAELLKDLAGTMAQSSGCNEVGTYHYCTLQLHHLTIRGHCLEQQSCKILCTHVHLSFYP